MCLVCQFDLCESDLTCSISSGVLYVVCNTLVMTASILITGCGGLTIVNFNVLHRDQIVSALFRSINLQNMMTEFQRPNPKNNYFECYACLYLIHLIKIKLSVNIHITIFCGWENLWFQIWGKWKVKALWLITCKFWWRICNSYPSVV